MNDTGSDVRVLSRTGASGFGTNRKWAVHLQAMPRNSQDSVATGNSPARAARRRQVTQVV